MQTIRRFLDWVAFEKEGLTVLKTIYLIDFWNGKFIWVPTVPIIFKNKPENRDALDLTDFPII